MASAWKQGIDGSGVKVAVLDTQAVEDYPALKDADITYRLGRFSGMDGKQVEVVRSERPIDCPYIGLDDGGVANERVVVRLVQTQRFAAVMLPFDCRDVIKTGQ